LYIAADFIATIYAGTNSSFPGSSTPRIKVRVRVRVRIVVLALFMCQSVTV